MPKAMSRLYMGATWPVLRDLRDMRDILGLCVIDKPPFNIRYLKWPNILRSSPSSVAIPGYWVLLA